MTKVLRTMKGLWRGLSSFFLSLYLWTAALVSSLVIVIMIFFFFFLFLASCFLMYIFCVPVVSYAFNDISITL